MSDQLSVKLTAGGLSGIVTKTAVQPLERVRTILQIQGQALGAKDAAWYSVILRTFVTVLREE